MFDDPSSIYDEQWVIWNVFFGVRDFVTIGEIEVTDNGKQAWLEEPYDMVGPFCLDELVSAGQISFAECLVMSYQNWNEHRVELQLKAQNKQRAAHEKLFKQQDGFKQNRSHTQHFQHHKEKEYRASLNLPADGELKPSEIKAAFRRRAQKTHPDVGGSHEVFIQITEARDALLAAI